MEYQWFQEFLSSPQLPDILAYLLIGVGYISQFFTKRFVKKDNFMTISKIDTKFARLKSMEAKLESSDKEHLKERKEWAREKQSLLEENKVLKKAIILCCFNNKELVKNGIANEVGKLLSLEEDAQGESINE